MICFEAVQTVLDLTETYARLFTLRQTPCLIPYFVFGAGLNRILLALDSPPPGAAGGSPRTGYGRRRGRGTDTTATTTPDNRPSTSLGQSDVVREDATATTGGSVHHAAAAGTTASGGPMLDGSSDSDRRPRSSAGADDGDEGGLTQAVRQLDAMSLGHHAASQAGWVLRDFRPNHSFEA
jgi:hypothetical protein